MSSPRNLKELRSLPGRLQPLISKARTRCPSFSRQDANFVWRPKHKEKRLLFLDLDIEFRDFSLNSSIEDKDKGKDKDEIAYFETYDLGIFGALSMVKERL